MQFAGPVLIPVLASQRMLSHLSFISRRFGADDDARTGCSEL